MFLQRRGRRAGGRITAVAIAALAILVVVAGPAAAHPTLLTTVPAAGYSGAGPLGQVVLAFDEPVTATAAAVQVTGADGRPVPTGPLQRQAGDRELILPLRPPVTSGQFRVHWQVTASDGDIVDGTFAFGVATAAPKAAAAGGAGNLAGTAVLRWLLFTALAVATGGLLGERLACRAAKGVALPAVRTPLRTATLLGFAAAVGLTGQLMGAAGGWSALTSVRAGGLAAVDAAAFAAAFAVAAAATRLPRLRPLAALPLTAVLVSEGLRAHPEAYVAGWGAALTAVHLGAAALWAGALFHVVRTALAWRGRAGRGQLLLLGYGPVALALYLLVAATGTLAALLVLAQPSDLLTTGYGRVLSAKLLLVAAITVLAVFGRRRIHRLPAAATPPTGAPPTTSHPGAVTRAERWLLVAVLAVTAVLVSLPAPRPTTTTLPLPPPPVGPTTAFGTLVGQLSLGATASTGQLQLALSAPDISPGEPGANAGALAAHLTAVLRAPGAEPAKLNVHGCGSGCFLAPAGWRNGINQLIVTADAAGWHGETATFTVPWPPVNATNQLKAMITALQATPMLDLTEATTSDTTGPTFPTDLHIRSTDFLEAEPYGNGAAPAVTALPPRPQDGLARIAISYPASGIYITVTLDRSFRPVNEVEATPNHLITRTFRYPAT